MGADFAIYLMVRALQVLTRDPRIREWLMANDPKALEQAERALKEGEATHGLLDRDSR